MSLIKDIENDVMPFVDVDQNITLESINPDIEDKEEKELKPILGATLYADIHTKYNSETPSLTDPEKELLRLSQKVINNFAFADAIDSLQLSLNDNAVTAGEGAQEKRPYKYQIENFRTQCLKRAYSGVESLLEFLFDNTAVFPTWSESEYSNSEKEFFLNSAIEFQQFEDIKKNRSTFEALKPLMRDVERIALSSVMGRDFLADLKSKLKADSLNEEEEYLLNEYLRPALSKFTIADACDALSVEIKGNGIVINQLKQEGDEELSAPDAKIQRKRTFAQRNGDFYLNKMREYLNETASETKFTIFFNSDKYDNTKEETVELSKRNVYRG